MNIRKKNTITNLFVAAIFFVFLQDMNVEASTGCVVSNKEVSVKMNTNLIHNSAVHTFEIVNDSKNIVYGFVVGQSDKDELRDVPFQKIKVVKSPAGWDGRVTINSRTAYRRLFWFLNSKSVKNGDFSLGIGPNKKESKFVVQIDQPSTELEQQFYMDGSPVIPYKIVGLPYRIYFSNGGCVGGRLK